MRYFPSSVLAICVLAGCGGKESGSTGAQLQSEVTSSTAAEGDGAGRGLSVSGSDDAMPAAPVGDVADSWIDDRAATNGHTARKRADFADTSESYVVSPPKPDPIASTARIERRPAPTDKPKRQIQSGTLTAGSIDDHVKFDEFRSYMSTAQQRGLAGELFAYGIDRRIIITVKNAAGEAIGDARVTLRQDPRQQQGGNRTQSPDDILLNVATGSDGRALFIPRVDAPRAGTEFLLSVTPPGGGDSMSQRVSVDQSPWTVTLPQAKAALPTKLDLALVVDTTGSMGDELEYLKVEIDNIAAAVRERFPNVDQRYSLILYRDQGDQYVTRTFDFTSSLHDFRNTLAKQSAAGGGDYPEAMHLALDQATHLSWRKTKTARVLFLVGDAPPHSAFTKATFDAIKQLRAAEVTMFPVAASGVRDRAEFVMRNAAFLTLGQYLFLTDHSGVGNPHAKPHTSQFSVERLDQLMIRMIAIELAGKPLLPRDIIANENSNPISPTEPLQPEGQHQTQVPPFPYEGVPEEHYGSAQASLLNQTQPSLLFRWLLAGVALVGFLFLDRRC